MEKSVILRPVHYESDLVLIPRCDKRAHTFVSMVTFWLIASSSVLFFYFFFKLKKACAILNFECFLNAHKYVEVSGGG